MGCALLCLDVRFEEPEVFVEHARHFSEEIGSVGVTRFGGGIDRASHHSLPGARTVLPVLRYAAVRP
jgi:hypothetical protein